VIDAALNCAAFCKSIDPLTTFVPVSKPVIEACEWFCIAIIHFALPDAVVTVTFPRPSVPTW
jgi:hypothetical protein